MNITAQNTFTTPVFKSAGQHVGLSVQGTFVATVVTQRSRDGSTNWGDADSVTAPTEKDAVSGGNWYWRAGVKTGGYTSGTAVVNVY